MYLYIMPSTIEAGVKALNSLNLPWPMPLRAGISAAPETHGSLVLGDGANAKVRYAVLWPSLNYLACPGLSCPVLSWHPQLQSKCRCRCKCPAANMTPVAVDAGPLATQPTAHLRAPTAQPKRLNIVYTIGVCMSVMKQWLLPDPCSLAWPGKLVQGVIRSSAG